MSSETYLPAIVTSWLGNVVVVDEAVLTVDRGYIESFAAAVRDGNTCYWDEQQADQLSGGIVAPPAMISAWTRPYEWAPEQPEQANRPLELHFRVKDALALPKAIVIENDTTYFEPVRPGDRVLAEQVLDEVSDLKTNRLGQGRNWTISIIYRRQDGALLGRETIRFFGYGGLNNGGG